MNADNLNDDDDDTLCLESGNVGDAVSCVGASDDVNYNMAFNAAEANSIYQVYSHVDLDNIFKVQGSNMNYNIALELQDANLSTHTETEPLISANLMLLPSYDSVDINGNITDTMTYDACEEVHNIKEDSEEFVIEHKIRITKLSKNRRRKFQRAQIAVKKESYNQKRREKEKYATDTTYREKKKMQSYCAYHESVEQRQAKIINTKKQYCSNSEVKEKKKQYSKKCYQNNIEFRQKKIQRIIERYQNSAEFRQKQKLFITQRYRENAEFRQRQKSYITQRYQNSAEFRQRQKSFITQRYQNSAEFRQRQKSFITQRYQNNAEFRQRQKSFITQRYQNSAEFRQRQKQYILNRYGDNVGFRRRQQAYMTNRYAHDAVFRFKHKELMKQKMQERYQNKVFRIMHKMRCVMKIKRKYKHLTKRTKDNYNTLIEMGISVFKTQIKSGPTFVCTVCHKAAFPNQVRPCIRTKYVRNLHVVAACLTGKYLHVCNNDCRNQQCKVPDERKKEWICYTCHNHVKNG
ncbi:MAG: hypothetical protein ACRC4Q_11995, partial [Paraclostridium dentum]